MSEDLISRGALLADFEEDIKNGNQLSYGDTEELILRAPTVPAEIVVHCCDCECGTPNLIDQGHTEPPDCDGIYCEKFKFVMDFIDYCSYGERRESEVEK